MKACLPLLAALLLLGPASATDEGTVPMLPAQIQTINEYFPVFGHEGMICKSGRTGVAKSGVYVFADCEMNGKAYQAILKLPHGERECLLLSVKLVEKEEK